MNYKLSSEQIENLVELAIQYGLKIVAALLIFISGSNLLAIHPRR